jgi:hypothetical protein
LDGDEGVGRGREVEREILKANIGLCSPFELRELLVC